MYSSPAFDINCPSFAHQRPSHELSKFKSLGLKTKTPAKVSYCQAPQLRRSWACSDDRFMLGHHFAVVELGDDLGLWAAEKGGRNYNISPR